MSGLTFTKDPSPSLPNKPLNDPDVGPDLIGGTVSYDGQHELSGVKFSFNAEGKANVKAFNSLDDKDEDGVLGTPPKAGSEFEVKLPPQIALTTERAWLKYRYAAKARASVSGAVTPLEFKIDGEKDVVFADYHVHEVGENTLTAFQADLTGLRFAAIPEDAFKLKEGEALSYQVRGELSASLTLSWSDVFTAGLGSISQLLKSGQLLTINISAAASVKFNVGLVDDFRIIFTKGNGENVRIALKKSDSREVGVAATLGVSVKFADENAVKDVLTKLVESVAGESEAMIDNILNKATLNDLTEDERAIVQALSQRLGLGGIVQTLEDLKEQWEALKKKVEDTISKIAKAKVEAGFTYEYLRVSAEDTLLIAQLDRNSFKACHNDLILCDIRSVLDHVQTAPNVLENYLNQKTSKRAQAWGFTLGIGSWNIGGGKDKKELTRIVQQNIEKRQRIAYRGLRSYESKWLGNGVNYTVDFKADMKEFSKDQMPNACEFQYGLHFKWAWEEKKLKKSELLECLDYAVIWRILTSDNVDEVIDKIGNNINQKAQASVEFTIDDATLRALLPVIAAADLTKVGETNMNAAFKALAKAMPYIDKYEARRLPKLRELCYAPLWQYYFGHKDMSDEVFPSAASQILQNVSQQEHIPLGGLDSFEKGPPGQPEKTYTNQYTFSGQIHLNGYTGSNYAGIYNHWIRFATALSSLRIALEPGKCPPHKIIEDIFKDLSSFWGQSFFVRAAGIYLLDMAAGNSDLLKKINRAFTVTFENGEVFTFNAPV